MVLQHPSLLWISLLLLPFVWWQARSRLVLGHSSLHIHKNLSTSSYILLLPRLARSAAWIMIAVALSAPQTMVYGEKQAISSRDFVIVFDTSGSMSEPIADPENVIAFSRAYAELKAKGEDQKGEKVFKRYVAEGALHAFIDQRGGAGDRLAALMFGDQCFGRYPLTTDMAIMHRLIVDVAKFNGSGTNLEIALQCGLDHLEEFGQAKSKVVILVTDGESSIADDVAHSLSEQARRLDARVYVLGIGDEWNGSGTKDLRQWVATNNGKVFSVTSSSDMKDALQEIDRLEKSVVLTTQSIDYLPNFAPFVLAALLLLLVERLLTALLKADV